MRRLARPERHDLRFVRAPDVAFYRASPHPESNVRFIATVRLSRALPQGGHGIQAAIDLSGAVEDPPGIRRVEGTRRCYQEENLVGGPRTIPRDGQVVTVRLTVTFGDVLIQSAGGGASCATARRVLTAVGRWVDDHFDDLDVRHHRDNLGFRCTVAQVGEADWTITCTRGRRVVRGSVSA